MRIRVQDQIILAAHVADTPLLVEKIASLKPGEAIRLKVDGVLGTWIKIAMRDGGAVRQGLAPLGEMATYWSAMVDLSVPTVDIEIVAASDPDDEGYLVFLDARMSEWHSSEDDEAFRGLRPI